MAALAGWLSTVRRSARKGAFWNRAAGSGGADGDAAGLGDGLGPGLTGVAVADGRGVGAWLGDTDGDAAGDGDECEPGLGVVEGDGDGDAMQATPGTHGPSAAAGQANATMASSASATAIRVDSTAARRVVVIEVKVAR
ncbi:MAG: hypothetical protein NVSMB17_11350 [Candidatus Dormibacteria bacterium]